MSNERAIEIIRNEQKCVSRADLCNRDCYNCDLVLPDKEILEAYDLGIKALSTQDTCHWMKSHLIKPFGEDTVQCDKCGFYTDVDNNYDYCPHCGRRVEQING